MGDAERDAVATQLREHWSLGRLKSEELEARLAATYRAKTRKDLAALLADLPGLDAPSAPRAGRFLLPGVAPFHVERRLRASPAEAYEAAWNEIVPRLQLRGYYLKDDRSPMRMTFTKGSLDSLTVTFRPAADGGTVVTAFGHAPRAIRKAFASLRD